jgi:hypothetical protein
MRRTTKLVIVMLLALSAAGCQWSRNGSQTAYTDPFANPSMKVAAATGQPGAETTKHR